MRSTRDDTNRESDERDRRSRRRALVVAVVVLLLLLLCSWCLWWPVPSSEVQNADDARGMQVARGPIVVEVIDSRVVEGEVSSKGEPVLVDFEMTSTRITRRFDVTFVRLQVGNTQIPAIARADIAGTYVPSELPADVPVKASALFAVPRGATEATLHVQPSDVSPESAGVVGFSLPQELR